MGGKREEVRRFPPSEKKKGSGSKAKEGVGEGGGGKGVVWLERSATEGKNKLFFDIAGSNDDEK